MRPLHNPLVLVLSLLPRHLDFVPWQAFNDEHCAVSVADTKMSSAQSVCRNIARTWRNLEVASFWRRMKDAWQSDAMAVLVGSSVLLESTLERQRGERTAARRILASFSARPPEEGGTRGVLAAKGGVLLWVCHGVFGVGDSWAGREGVVGVSVVCGCAWSLLGGECGERSMLGRESARPTAHRNHAPLNSTR